MDADLATEIGEVLREYRHAAEMSQEQLAHACDLDRTYISMLERGVRQPTVSTLFRLSNALNVRPSKIIKELEDRAEAQ